MNTLSSLSRLGPVVARKRADRATRSLDALAVGDQLLHRAVKIVVAEGGYSVPVLDYITRKKRALRADAFRLRYGRDYWTNRPRHATARAARREAALRGDR